MHPADGFWFLAGVLVVVALLFVVYPWLSGEQRSSLWLSLPRWVLPAGVGLIVVAMAIYLKIGSPQLAARDSVVASASAAMPAAAPGAPGMAAAGGAAPAAAQGAGSMDSAVTGLERRLAAGGGNDGDWELLAKSYEFLNRPADAAAARRKQLPAGAGQGPAPGAAAAAGAPPAAAIAAAPQPVLSPEAAKLKAAADDARRKRDFNAAKASYAKLVARKEMNADAWADYADVLATLNGNKLAGPPEALLRNALALDPNHPKALWLQASLEHETGRYAAAAGTWQHLAAVLGPQSGDAPLIASNLAEDQRLAGGGAPAAAPGATAGVAAGARPGVAIQGDVVLADNLAGKVPAGLTLFILAKSVQSPGPPVAILKLTTGTWPVHFQLDDSQSMIPGRNLSTAGPVTVEARTSRSGQAAPQPGDFQGVVGPLNPAGSKPLRLVIGKVVS